MARKTRAKNYRSYRCSITLDIYANNANMAKRIFSNVVKNDPHHPMQKVEIKRDKKHARKVA